MPFFSSRTATSASWGGDGSPVISTRGAHSDDSVFSESTEYRIVHVHGTCISPGVLAAGFQLLRQPLCGALASPTQTHTFDMELFVTRAHHMSGPLSPPILVPVHVWPNKLNRSIHSLKHVRTPVGLYAVPSEFRVSPLKPLSIDLLRGPVNDDAGSNENRNVLGDGEDVVLNDEVGVGSAGINRDDGSDRSE